MGLVLLGLSAGSMVGILFSGPAVARLGAKPVMVVGTLGVILSLPTIGAGASAGSIALTACGLFIFGLGMGGGEIAMNVGGADIEKTIHRPVLPALHGFFSLGTVIGASLGILFTAVDFPVVWHLNSIGLIALGIRVVAARAIPNGTGRVHQLAVVRHSAAGGGRLSKDSRLLLIARFGRAPVLRVSILAGVAGMALVIFIDSQWVAAAAVILWGLGASLGFPVALSAAGESGEDSARRVSLAATIGCVAFLVGPPVIGFVGEHYGLRAALILPLILVAASVFITPAVREREDSAVSV